MRIHRQCMVLGVVGSLLPGVAAVHAIEKDAGPAWAPQNSDGSRYTDPIQEQLLQDGLPPGQWKEGYEVLQEAARLHLPAGEPALQLADHAAAKRAAHEGRPLPPVRDGARDAPPNNDCGSATYINAGTHAFNTTEATVYQTTSCGYQSGPDVWFRFRASCDGNATVSTCDNANFDTILAAYDGCGGTELACNDDYYDGSGYPCNLQSQITFPVQLNQYYTIQVSGYNGATGSGAITLSYDCSVPYNNSCLTATTVQAGRTEFSTVGATVTATLNCIYNNGPDVWFRWTPSCSATATFSTCDDADYDTALGVWSACGGTLLACDDDEFSCTQSLTSRIELPVQAGTTYYIQVSGYYGYAGSGGLTISGPAPANNHCAQATPITGAGSWAYCTEYADQQVTIPCAAGGGPDVWFLWTAPCHASASFSTCSNPYVYDTAITLWDACGGTVLACNDDNCNLNGLQSTAYLEVPEGSSVLVQMSGFYGNRGAGTLAIGYDCITPVNDDCSNAFPVHEGIQAYNSTGATTDGPDEPTACNEFGYTQVGSDIWYRWQPPLSGVTTIDLSGSQYDTKMAVYQGACPTGPAAIACDDDGGTDLDSRVVFAACAGETYLVRIGGYSGYSGVGSLALSHAPDATLPLPPENLAITILGDDVRLDWDPVDTSAFGCAISGVVYRVWRVDRTGLPTDLGTVATPFVLLPLLNQTDTVYSFYVESEMPGRASGALPVFRGNTLLLGEHPGPK